MICSEQNLKEVTPELTWTTCSDVWQQYVHNIEAHLMDLQGSGFSYTKSRLSLNGSYGKITSVIKGTALSHVAWFQYC
jgi:hypothetical protein